MRGFLLMLTAYSVLKSSSWLHTLCGVHWHLARARRVSMRPDLGLVVSAPKRKKEEDRNHWDHKTSEEIWGMCVGTVTLIPTWLMNGACWRLLRSTNLSKMKMEPLWKKLKVVKWLELSLSASWVCPQPESLVLFCPYPTANFLS